jgi:hypothetical protein
MATEENAVRDLLTRARDLIAEERPNFGYVVVLVDLDEPNVYVPLNYATNLVPDGVVAVGEFLGQVAGDSNGEVADFPLSETSPSINVSPQIEEDPHGHHQR